MPTVVSVTAANVATVTGTGEDYGYGTAGGTITAGMALAIDTANSNVIKAADANASAILSTVCGIALHAALTGQPIKYQKAGSITIGGTVVAGTIYVLGAVTAGDINVAADVASGWWTSIIGVASSATVIKLSINNSGVQT